MNAPELPDYGDLGRDSLLIDGGRESFEWIAWDLRDLGVFYGSVEALIEAEHGRISERHSGPPEDYPGWWLDDIVADRLRRSALAAAVDAAAIHLGLVCRNVAAVQRVPDPTMDREPILAAKRFLLEHGFAAPVESMWQDLQDLYKLRNQVVHTMGVIPDGDEGVRFRRLAERLPGLCVDQGLIVLTSHFVPAALSLVEEFFTDLRAELSALCNSVRRRPDD